VVHPRRPPRTIISRKRSRTSTVTARPGRSARGGSVSAGRSRTRRSARWMPSYRAPAGRAGMEPVSGRDGDDASWIPTHQISGPGLRQIFRTAPSPLLAVAIAFLAYPASRTTNPETSGGPVRTTRISCSRLKSASLGPSIAVQPGEDRLGHRAPPHAARHPGVRAPRLSRAEWSAGD